MANKVVYIIAPERLLTHWHIDLANSAADVVNMLHVITCQLQSVHPALSVVSRLSFSHHHHRHH